MGQTIGSRRCVPMSEMGQKAKYSRRADVFRCTPKTGHRSMQSACPKRANPGLPLNEIISPGADPGQGGDYAKACSHVCSDPEKSLTFVPQPKFNGDPLLIKRERCLITDASYRHFSSCHFGEG